MTSLMPHRATTMPDLLEWFETQWPLGDRHAIRVETYTDEGELVIRCELPGMDPERDIHITVDGNQLKISAERSREERTDKRTEFQYGAFTRTLNLPHNCNLEEIKADYDAGILTVHVPERESSASKEIPVARSGR